MNQTERRDSFLSVLPLYSNREESTDEVSVLRL